MASNLFSGLGEAINGVVSEIAKSGLAPQDDLGVRMISTKSSIAELRKKENEIFSEIGRKVYHENPSEYSQSEELLHIQDEIAELEERVKGIEKEIKEKEKGDIGNSCPNCGSENVKGMKFCQECGTKLELSETHTCSCGATVAPNMSFCGECGAKIE